MLIPSVVYTIEDGEGNITGSTKIDGTERRSLISADTVVVGILYAVQSEFEHAEVNNIVRGGLSLIPNTTDTAEDGNGNITSRTEPSGVQRINKLTVGDLTADTLIANALSVAGGNVVGQRAVSSLLPTTLRTSEDANGNISGAVAANGVISLLPNPRYLFKRQWQTVRPTQILSYTPPRTNADVPVASGTTIATLWSFDLHFDWIRVVYGYQGVGTCNVSFVVAATAAANNGVDPLNDTGSPVSWKTGTFNNGGEAVGITPWNQTTGNTNTVQLNTDAREQVWGLTASDWIPVTSLYRTDNSPHPLLMIRTYLTGQPLAVAQSGSTWYGLSGTDATRGRTWAAYSQSGDYVSSTAGMTGGTNFADVWAPLFVQTYCRGLGFQTWGDGDSNMAGPQNLLSHQQRACNALSLRGTPVIRSNFNQGGTTPDIYNTNVNNILDIVRPSSVVSFPWSYNDIPNETRTNINWANSMALCQRIQSYGGVPLLLSYPPRENDTTPITAEKDHWRLESIRRLDYCAENNMLVVNSNSLIADTTVTPQIWLPGRSTDRVHYNDVSNAIVGDLMAARWATAFGV